MTALTTAPAWISARHLQHFVARGDAEGLPVEKWLAENGLSREVLSDGNGSVPLATLESLLAMISQHFNDPLLGMHLAKNIQPASLGVLGYVFQSCTTLADILDVLVRFNGLLSNIGETSVIFAPGVVEIRWACKAGGADFRRHAMEYVIAIAVTVIRLLLVEPIRLRGIHFAHERLDVAEHARELFTFYQCPVSFNRTETAIFIDSDALRQRLRHGDAFIKTMMEAHAEELLKKRQANTYLTDDVKRLVTTMILDDMPTRDMVAEQLGMSGRTLHRKLIAAGSSYQAILDGVRLEMATERLQGTKDSLTVIASSLRFSTHQAFLRWFKQMTDMTPGEFRRQAGVSV